MNRPEIDDQRILTAVLYMLMRDGDLALGTIEGRLQDLEGVPSVHDHEQNMNGEFRYSNGWLAGYASELADRLTKK